MREGKIIGLDTPLALKSSTFPKLMFEFNPKGSLSFDEVMKLGSNPCFSFFEPYGLRFHASIADEKAWELIKSQFEKDFYIKVISPSLEDVFIKRVEERK